MKEYLESSTYIDWVHPDVRRVAAELGSSESGTEAIARKCFEFVRDEIRHCLDGNDETVAAKASEVLEAGTGFCYAKSHLLAALLRANGIPTALCYQRFRGDRRTLHGLNAIHLGETGWYRVDPRGNKPGIDSQFTPPTERLAFQCMEEVEDVPGFWTEPAPTVIRTLTHYDSVSAARAHLPDRLE